MKILYFSQFYAPETVAAAFRATDNSRLWQQSGNEVTVFTGFPNFPKGKIFDGYTPELLKEENIEGVRVLRSKLVAAPNTSIVNRLKNYLSYYVYGRVNEILQDSKIGKDYDVVLGTSGIVFNALLAYKYAKRHHIPFVLELRDITYVQMRATGTGEDGKAVKVMKALELMLCRKAQKVVVVTQGFKDVLVGEGIPAEKIEVITNGVDVQPAEGAYDEGKPFKLSYFGTIGKSQNLKDTFWYAETIQKHVPDAQYLIIGDGAQREEVEACVEEENLSYVSMLPGMPAEDLEKYYRDTQLSIVILRKSDNFKHTIPSKIFQIMGRGIAIMFIGPDGESAEIIRKYKAGIVLTGTEAEDQVILDKFFEEPDWRERLKVMGENGRKAAEENYSRAKLAEQYFTLLEDAAKVEG